MFEHLFGVDEMIGELRIERLDAMRGRVSDTIGGEFVAVGVAAKAFGDAGPAGPAHAEVERAHGLEVAAQDGGGGHQFVAVAG
nr:hypothetical protein [Sphingomonas lutea]